MSKEGTTLIFIFVEFEDQSKYLACFGDMRMRSVAGVDQTQKKYRSFYEKCSKRTLADGDERKLYHLYNHRIARSTENIACVVGMAGIQKDDEMKTVEEQW
ncbi:hypothetical protein DdX_14366 [Ditylenchus destructor]|uniref:Uncharacterized protein n=1 Tax=Ditylenchus destructor TaxID=166010 RepID=A0AAD4R1R5_9BILA|nr:hypothetical protein DdX_14366 [Ditylenchus destructor]